MLVWEGHFWAKYLKIPQIVSYDKSLLLFKTIPYCFHCNACVRGTFFGQVFENSCSVFLTFKIYKKLEISWRHPLSIFKENLKVLNVLVSVSRVCKNKNLKIFWQFPLSIFKEQVVTKKNPDGHSEDIAWDICVHQQWSFLRLHQNVVLGYVGYVQPNKCSSRVCTTE